MITKDTLLLLNQFSIALYDKNLAYVKGQGYYILNRVGTEITLETLDKTTTLYPEREKKFPQIYDLSNRKSLTELSRSLPATTSLPTRNIVGTTSALTSEITNSQKKLAEKYNMVDFSEKLFGEQKQLAELTYRMILLALEKANQQKKSKTKVIEQYYKPAQKAVEEKNILNLENIKDEILKTVGKQNAIYEARQVSKATEKIWKKVQKRLIVLAAIITLLLLGLFFFNIYADRTATGREMFSQQKKTYSKTEIRELIIEYCSQKDTIITEWRMEYIIEKFPSEKMNKNEAIKEIKNLSVYQ